MTRSQIIYSQFEAVDIRVGTIITAEAFPQAHKPAYKLTIDLGPEIGLKKSSAQITELYTVEDVVGRQVLCVCNLPFKQVGPFISEVLTTGCDNNHGQVVLFQPDKPVPNGSKLY
jgi:tRNA-binding protein